MDIYKNKGQYKIVLLIVALLVAVGSIFYTQSLVSRLEQNEKRLIRLYADNQRELIAETNPANLNILFRQAQQIDSITSVPRIMTNDHGQVLSYLNVDVPSDLDEKTKEAYLKKEVADMALYYEPLKIDLSKQGIPNQYIYYKHSRYLSLLKYYPYIQLSIILALGILAYLAFSYSRRSEQNRVWVGLAKETAHQLGTPLSSLIAWLELMKQQEVPTQELVTELSKDVDRLEMITARFSSIGSAPSFRKENAHELVEEVILYLKARTSSKVHYSIASAPDHQVMIHVNKSLFAWVIENVCKNAIDAMEGKGQLHIQISLIKNKPCIDITDTGKGMPGSHFKKVFKPGFTTKQRGWGLGLTLVKRIVEEYHRGQIFVLDSTVNKGTTFRILLPLPRKEKA